MGNRVFLTTGIHALQHFLLLENINIILNYKLLQHRGVPKTKIAVNIDRYFVYTGWFNI